MDEAEENLESSGVYHVTGRQREFRMSLVITSAEYFIEGGGAVVVPPLCSQQGRRPLGPDFKVLRPRQWFWLGYWARVPERKLLIFGWANQNYVTPVPNVCDSLGKYVKAWFTTGRIAVTVRHGSCAEELTAMFSNLLIHKFAEQVLCMGAPDIVHEGNCCKARTATAYQITKFHHCIRAIALLRPVRRFCGSPSLREPPSTTLHSMPLDFYHIEVQALGPNCLSAKWFNTLPMSCRGYRVVIVGVVRLRDNDDSYVDVIFGVIVHGMFLPGTRKLLLGARIREVGTQWCCGHSFRLLPRLTVSDFSQESHSRTLHCLPQLRSVFAPFPPHFACIGAELSPAESPSHSPENFRQNYTRADCADYTNGWKRGKQGFCRRDTAPARCPEMGACRPPHVLLVFSLRHRGQGKDWHAYSRGKSFARGLRMMFHKQGSVTAYGYREMFAAGKKKDDVSHDRARGAGGQTAWKRGITHCCALARCSGTNAGDGCTHPPSTPIVMQTRGAMAQIDVRPSVAAPRLRWHSQPGNYTFPTVAAFARDFTPRRVGRYPSPSTPNPATIHNHFAATCQSMRELSPLNYAYKRWYIAEKIDCFEELMKVKRWEDAGGNAGMQGQGKREIPEKIRRPAAYSPARFLYVKIRGATPPGIA
ncbi:hypothetical protein PR048_031258 [Dryococelus australis]|uniref:Uncharacterized protein n=1 Tax=Dryococelus australis TaxID=614101 RepID=A0ABQ9G4R5_9NEOP|nr:hypothetical protein PR048_031258 [Dryococelus australis]